MPLPQKWNKKKRAPPAGFDVVEATLEALENEIRDKVKESNINKRKTESMWPIHQINWQKSRYIYDMYYTYHRISRQVYQYCLDQKLVDAALMAKWKKPGYERLCSTYVINSANYKFNTVSICRVPWKDRSPEQRANGVADPTTGCLGCASNNVKYGGPRNIFGNKYGQNLAAVQIARETRQLQLQEKRKLELKQQQQQRKLQEEQAAAAAAATAQEEKQTAATVAAASAAAGGGSGEEETDNETDGGDDNDTDDDDDDDDDDFGPSPAAGIWAGSQKLEQESEKIIDNNEQVVDGNNDEANEDDNGQDDDDYVPPPNKKVRTD